MANLETLELTISANAESASKGLSNLINSLSALSKEVSKNVSGLKLLNTEISKISTMRGINLGKVTNSANGIKAQTKALQDNAKAAQTWAEAQAAAGYPLTANNIVKAHGGVKRYRSVMPVAEATKAVAAQKSDLYDWSKTSTKMWNFQPKEAGAFVSQYGKGEEWKKAYYNPVSEATKGRASEHFSTEIKKVGEEADKAKPKVSGLSKALSRVGRIFSTMMIRTAIRSLIKAFSEAWQKAYDFSKSMGGEFAESVDKVKSLLAGTATNIISAFSPALSALVPIIQTVAGAIQYLCNIIKSLFSLIGGGTDLFGATADSINGFSQAAGGGGKAAKEMLATFDELNVISQESGGGGGGGGGSYKSGLFSDMISDEMARVQLIVSESLLALGLILACTGHIGLGVGLMAIGAAGIAKTVLEDWNKLPDSIQGELLTIMSVVGVAFLALGAILAFSGVNIPLGIGLMAIGAVNLAAVQYVNWTNGISDDVKKTISTIMEIVGSALLVIGAILAFSGANIPLGIGLMIAGGVSLASSVGLNWDWLVKKVTGAFESIKTFIVGAWDTITKAADDAWKAIKKWWEDSGVGQKVRDIWGGISGFFRGLYDNISEWAKNAWESVGKWWHTNVTSNFEKEGVWGGVKGFFEGVWAGISGFASDAWAEVTKWWETSGLGESVRGTWKSVVTVLRDGIWNPIKNTVTNAWNKVTDWWETSGLGTKVRGAWSSVVTVLRDSVWNPIKNYVTQAWDQVKQWWEKTGISKAISDAWAGVKSIFEDIFAPIKKALDWVRELLGINGKEIGLSVKITTYQNYTQAAQNIPKDVATAAGNILSNFFNTYNAATKGAGTSGGHGFASGGFPDRGEIFIAQEQGAELIGSINGKTSVANQQQIIEGIQRGVSEANAEQNVLLRQQNELLRGILEKDASVKIGASAALGRTVRQSLDMYGMVGG